MKGLELCEKFYFEYGEPMLKERFAPLLPHIAVGLCGGGSECFGYDDNISADHDFEPRFCIFLPSEKIVDRKSEFELERAYAKLPRTYLGYRRDTVAPVGGNRCGVIRMENFLLEKTGSADGNLPLKAWFSIPEQALIEATNGKIFFDGSGELTAIRSRLAYFPNDVRLKKLAGHIWLMGQAGQYNYSRCVSRGDTAAAQLCATEFVKSTLSVIFLLNRRYLPYYKWSFHALRDLDLLSDLYEPMEYLISSGNTSGEAETKQKIINGIFADVIAELRAQALTDFTDDTAEGHALSVNRRITDGNVRNLHILYGI